MQIEVAVFHGPYETAEFGAFFTNHKEMESEVVPENERTSPKYGGYALQVGVRELNEIFDYIGSRQK